ncbi:hypothetical protein HMPREF9278_1132 [Mobiluncus mulieris FB024-16]|nr:hypothetical protein HMPREF9278_1132 [Mobiluncus mulieris FB024-16]
MSRNSEPLTVTVWGSVVWFSIVVMVLVFGLACAVRAGDGCGYCLDSTPALIS